MFLFFRVVLEAQFEIVTLRFTCDSNAEDCIFTDNVSPVSMYHDNIMMSRCDSLGPLLAAISSFNRIFYASVTRHRASPSPAPH